MNISNGIIRHYIRFTYLVHINILYYNIQKLLILYLMQYVFNHNMIIYYGAYSNVCVRITNTNYQPLSILILLSKLREEY